MNIQTDWDKLTPDQKADALKVELKQAIDHINRRLDQLSDGIGSVTRKVDDLALKIQDIQSK